MRSLVLAVAALAVALSPGCGSDGEARDRTGEERLVLDWKRGTYGGVRLGDTTAQTIRALGRPQKRGRNEPIEPIGEDAYEIGALTNYSSPDIGRRVADFEQLRYRHRVFSTTGGRVTSWGVTDRGAETPEGVGVGDPRDLVKRRYRGANCYTANEKTEYADYPLCKVRVCKGRLLAFGGDPIKSVWLAATAKRGLKRCRRPA